jgi:hypothetical protein
LPQSVANQTAQGAATFPPREPASGLSVQSASPRTGLRLLYGTDVAAAHEERNNMASRRDPASSRQPPRPPLTCVECGATSRDGLGWKAYVGRDPEEDEAEFLLIYCPSCARREFAPDDE